MEVAWTKYQSQNYPKVILTTSILALDCLQHSHWSFLWHASFLTYLFHRLLPSIKKNNLLYATDSICSCLCNNLLLIATSSYILLFLRRDLWICSCLIYSMHWSPPTISIWFSSLLSCSIYSSSFCTWSVFLASSDLLVMPTQINIFDDVAMHNSAISHESPYACPIHPPFITSLLMLSFRTFYYL